jgi:cation diffusion facilitator family transporter
MATGYSKKPITIYGAIAANLIIAVSKFIVALLTGSSAMLSEAIHSTADTGNELLLLLGLHRGRKPADEVHPFGHGQEIYFWGLIVAIILFSGGGGMALYEGVAHLINPIESGNPTWNYVVLGIAFLAEGVSWTIALRELLRRQEKGESFWNTLRASKDPALFVPFGEDTAALAGLLVAFLGVFLGHLLNSPIPDGAASLMIGLILMAMAAFLAWESRSLLLGETADLKTVRGIQTIIQKNPQVDGMRQPLTMHFGPEEILLNVEVQFHPELTAAEIVKAVEELETAIRQEYPKVHYIFIEVEGFRGRGDGTTNQPP